jgi:hypothetical protein
MVVCFLLSLLAAMTVLAAKPLPRESGWTEEAGKHPSVTWRKWLEATVFPEFEFSGSAEGMIEHLMSHSRKVTPDGRTVGGFILRGDFDKVRVNIKLRGRNALEIVDALCALADATWTLAPHAIIIQRDAKPSTK